MPYFKAAFPLHYKDIKVRDIFEMAYKRIKYKFENSNEFEYRFKGECGAKGEKRAPRKKKTKEQIKRINQINREIRMRRKLKLNFSSNDYWCCFKYPAGTKLTIEEMNNNRKSLIKALQRIFKKHGVELKYIYRMEIGERGGLHFHMVINRIWGQQTDVIINKCWSTVIKNSFKRRGIVIKSADGLCDFKCMYDAGGFENLAKYICKQPKEESETYKQLSLFPESERKKLIKANPSRNLINPEPEEKEFSHLTVRKMITEGPTPTEGYYIDQDSIISGINPFTGLSYLKYTEHKLDQTEDGPPERRGIP